MLSELGLDIVMIGHSERRLIFGEQDNDENRKVKAALKHGFTALLCIWETKEEKEYGIGTESLRTQLIVGLHGVPADGLFVGRSAWQAAEFDKLIREAMSIRQ